MEGFEADLAAAFTTVAEFLPAKDVATAALVSRRLRAEAERNDFVWRTLCQRDFSADAPRGHSALRAYRFLRRWPRVGDLFEADVGGGWTVLRAVLRADGRRFLALPTRTPARAGVLRFVWFDGAEDATRLRALSSAGGGAAAAAFHATRSEQRALLCAAQRTALARLAEGGAALWPLWHPSLASLAMYGCVCGAELWDDAAGWLQWCCCPRLAACVAAETGGGDDDARLWHALQTHPHSVRPLQMCGRVLVDPRPGELLECLDTVNDWYCAQIVGVRHETVADAATGAELRVTTLRVSYDGWECVWDEDIDPVAQAHRLRPLGDSAACGPNGGINRTAHPRANFMAWEDFLRSEHFVAARWAKPDVYRILKAGHDPSALVGRLVEVTNMSSNALLAEIIDVRGEAVDKSTGETSPSSVQVRFYGVNDQVDTLRIVEDRHRLRPLPSSRLTAASCFAGKLAAEFVSVPFEQVPFDSPPWDDPL